jgi:hypothetical protein
MHSLLNIQVVISNINRCPLDTPLRDQDLLAVHRPPTADRYISLCITDDTVHSTCSYVHVEKFPRVFEDVQYGF